MLVTWLRQRGALRIVFDVFVGVQVLHLGEHVVQMVQIHVWQWPPPLARGVIGALDIEKVHAAWNIGVLVALAWLLHRGARSPWVIATLVWAALHTSEHAYLLARALRSGLESQPGILGVGGLLARTGLRIAGITTWTRPAVHLAWNVGEVALLLLAYLAFRRAALATPAAGYTVKIT
jgi:hypothetical protein